MLSSKDVADVLALLFSSPGMDATVKIGFRASRKANLLLVKLIDLGLASRDNPEVAALFNAVGEEHVESLRGITSEILASAEVSEMYQKLNLLQTKS